MSSMQKNRYQEMRERHQAEVNDFPLMFAFDARQFAEGLRRLGLRSSDKDKVCALPGTGGFCRKSDLPALKGMFARHHRELQEANGADPTRPGIHLRDVPHGTFQPRICLHTGRVGDAGLPWHHTADAGSCAAAPNRPGAGVQIAFEACLKGPGRVRGAGQGAKQPERYGRAETKEGI